MNKSGKNVITVERIFQAIFYFLSLSVLYYYLMCVHPWLLELRKNIGYKPTIEFMPADSYPFYQFIELKSLEETPLGILGPVFLGKILFNSYILIFSINILLLYYSVITFLQAINRNNYLIKTLIIFQPFVIVNTFYVNKEIYMLLSGFFSCRYLIKEEKKFLLLALAFSFLTKLEFIAILTIFFITRNLPERRFVALFSLATLLIGLLYKHIPGINSKAGVLLANIDEDKFSLSKLFFSLSYDNYLFPLVALPKAVHVYMLGIIEAVKFPISNIANMTNLSFSVTSSVLGIACIYLIIKMKHIPKSFYFVLLLTLIVATIPFNVSRYLFPIFPFLLTTFFLLQEKKNSAVS